MSVLIAAVSGVFGVGLVLAGLLLTPVLGFGATWFTIVIGLLMTWYCWMKFPGK